jgi:hypothetical protein
LQGRPPGELTGLDLSEHKHVVFPICQREHWSAIILFNVGFQRNNVPLWMHLDSGWLQGPEGNLSRHCCKDIVKVLVPFVKSILAGHVNAPDITAAMPIVPSVWQQLYSNNSCALHMLTSIMLFCHAAPEYIDDDLLRRLGNKSRSRLVAMAKKLLAAMGVTSLSRDSLLLTLHMPMPHAIRLVQT